MYDTLYAILNNSENATLQYFIFCKKALDEKYLLKVSNGAKIRNRYNQVPHLTQDTNGKVTNSQKTPQTRAKRSALLKPYNVFKTSSKRFVEAPPFCLV